MGKTYRHGCDYGEKPNPRIARTGMGGRAVEESQLESLGKVDNPLKQELFLLSLSTEVIDSLHDRLLDDLYSLGEQAISQEVEFVA